MQILNRLAATSVVGVFLAATAPASAQVSSANAYAGVYKGPATTTSGGVCVNYAAVLTVQGDSFSMPYSQRATLEGAVGHDGSVSAQGTYTSGRGGNSNYTVAGKIAASVATLQIDTPRCHYDLKLTKAG